MGVVPLGIPLIIGPAAITSVLVSREAYGYLPTLTSLVINMFLVYLTLAFAPWIGRVMGPAVSRAVAKVASEPLPRRDLGRAGQGRDRGNDPRALTPG